MSTIHLTNGMSTGETPALPRIYAAAPAGAMPEVTIDGTPRRLAWGADFALRAKAHA